MDGSAKNRYISIISSGILILKYNNQNYYIRPPTSLLQQESYYYYDSVLDDLVFEDLLTNDELDKFLLERDLVDPNIDKTVDTLNKQQEALKVEACENWMNVKKVKLLKTAIRTIDKNIISLLSAKHAFDHLTKEGYAEQCRMNYIVIQSVYNKEGRQVNIEDDAILCDKILTLNATNILNSSILRELARTDPWQSIYNASPTFLFGSSGCEMTENQKNLLSYSRMYDTISKHPECPNQTIYNDDDLLDGWMIIQRKNTTKDTNNDKYGNAQEVYLMANDNATRQNIDNMNSLEAKQKKIIRHQTLQKKGTMSEIDFPDVQQELRQQIKK